MASPDPLDDLRDQLRATSEAARRVAGEVPSQGWASEEQRDATTAEVRALVDLLHGLRALVPEDLWVEVREVVRRLLVLLRALLDAAVDRLAAPAVDAAPEPRVQDIPIG